MQVLTTATFYFADRLQFLVSVVSTSTFHFARGLGFWVSVVSTGTFPKLSTKSLQCGPRTARVRHSIVLEPKRAKSTTKHKRQCTPRVRPHFEVNIEKELKPPAIPLLAKNAAYLRVVIVVLVHVAQVLEQGERRVHLVDQLVVELRLEDAPHAARALHVEQRGKYMQIYAKLYKIMQIYANILAFADGFLRSSGLPLRYQSISTQYLYFSLCTRPRNLGISTQYLYFSLCTGPRIWGISTEYFYFAFYFSEK